MNLSGDQAIVILMRNRAEVKSRQFLDDDLDLQSSGIMLNLSSTVYGEWGLNRTAGSKYISSKFTGRHSMKTEQTPHRIHCQPEPKTVNTSMKRRSQTQKKWREEGETHRPQTTKKCLTRYSQRKGKQQPWQLYGPLSATRSFWKRKQQPPWQKQEIRTGKSRITSEPSKRVSKPPQHELMNRITRKISFIKKMTESTQKTSEVNHSKEQSSMFQFQRLYDQCLRKIKRGINTYERDYDKTKDKKYYELKLQSQMLNKEFRHIRSNIERRRLGDIVGTAENLGVVGNNIDLKAAQKPEKSQKAQTQRPSNAYFSKKKSKVSKKTVEKNPFQVKQMQGWNVAHERNYKLQDFLL